MNAKRHGLARVEQKLREKVRATISSPFQVIMNEAAQPSTVLAGRHPSISISFPKDAAISPLPRARGTPALVLRITTTRPAKATRAHRGLESPRRACGISAKISPSRNAGLPGSLRVDAYVNFAAARRGGGVPPRHRTVRAKIHKAAWMAVRGYPWIDRGLPYFFPATD